jgi:hypothetical protein
MAAGSGGAPMAGSGGASGGAGAEGGVTCEGVVCDPHQCDPGTPWDGGLVTEGTGWQLECAGFDACPTNAPCCVCGCSTSTQVACVDMSAGTITCNPGMIGCS